jgi:hypothetical protein
MNYYTASDIETELLNFQDKVVYNCPENQVKECILAYGSIYTQDDTSYIFYDFKDYLEIMSNIATDKKVEKIYNI